jgi:DNA-binding MarR family transcriptional regulator
MNGSINITIAPRPVEDRLNGITENILLFFPLFYRNILRLNETRVKNPINMQTRILLMLTHSGQMPTSEIGTRMGISRPNVTSLVDKLLAQGYVQRIHDEKDRRVIHILVTGKGRKFAAGRLQMVRKGIRKNLSVLTRGDIDSLYSALETFRQVITKMDMGGQSNS